MGCPVIPKPRGRTLFMCSQHYNSRQWSPSYHDNQKTEGDVGSLAASLGHNLDMVPSPKPQAKPSSHSSVSLACISVASNSPGNQTHKLLDLCCGSFMRY